MAFMSIEDIRVDRGFASCLPSPGENEFQGLVEDIRTRGVVVDLLLTKDGLLLDGHRRLKAAKEAGLSKVPVKLIEGETDWQKAVAIAVNLYRRNLNEVQRACLGSSLLRIERERAKERQHEGQERGRVRRWHQDLVVDGDHPQPKERLRATQVVAERVGVSTEQKTRYSDRNDGESSGHFLAPPARVIARIAPGIPGPTQRCVPPQLSHGRA